MSMENAAWHSLWRMSGDKGKAYADTTPRRVLAFAASYKNRLLVFVLFSVCLRRAGGDHPGAGRPGGRCHRGQVRDPGGDAAGRCSSPWWRSPMRRSPLVIRWFSSRLGEGIIFDLRTAVFDHVQKMPIAFFTRTRTGALVSRLNNDVIGAQSAFAGTLSGLVSQRRGTGADRRRHVLHLLAGHRAGAGAAAGLPDPGTALRQVACAAAQGIGRPQRLHGHADDRAVLRPGRHPGQALWPPGRGIARVRRCGPAGCGTSA